MLSGVHVETATTTQQTVTRQIHIKQMLTVLMWILARVRQTLPNHHNWQILLLLLLNSGRGQQILQVQNCLLCKLKTLTVNPLLLHYLMNHWWMMRVQVQRMYQKNTANTTKKKWILCWNWNQSVTLTLTCGVIKLDYIIALNQKRLMSEPLQKMLIFLMATIYMNAPKHQT